MSKSVQRSEWIKRILGVTIPLASMGTVSAGPPDPKIKKPGNGKTLGQDGARSGKTIAPPRPPMQFGGADRPITVAKSPGGGVVFTAPPPPVRDITFSGGGGKGAALPGAVKALEESGVLKDVQAVNGASVGAMTAALVAAGITAKEMAAAADAPETTAAITEGTGGSMLKMLSKAVENRGSPLTGMGLQQVVGKVLEGTLLARVTEYIEGCQKSGTAPDPVVKDTIEKVGAEGPTFAQMRALSQVIPAIKDLSITGTYTTEKVVELDGQEHARPAVRLQRRHPARPAGLRRGACVGLVPRRVQAGGHRFGAGLDGHLHRRRRDEQHADREQYR